MEGPVMDDESVWATYELTGVLTHQVHFLRGCGGGYGIRILYHVCAALMLLHCQLWVVELSCESSIISCDHF